MTKDLLIQSLIGQGVFNDQKILRAFLEVDRKDFVLPEYQDFAYEDHPLPIGFGQTISQPYTVAFMLNLLNVQEGDKVLDIGCGSGWTTVLLSHLVGKKGRVIGIERIPELAKFARSNLSKYPILQRTRLPKPSMADGKKSVNQERNKVQSILKAGNDGQASTVQIICGDGVKGFIKEAPFDKIIAAATAEDVPLAWKEQLKIGGRIVAPVKDSIIAVEKISKNKFQTKEYRGFIFVPLIEN